MDLEDLVFSYRKKFTLMTSFVQEKKIHGTLHGID